MKCFPKILLTTGAIIIVLKFISRRRSSLGGYTIDNNKLVDIWGNAALAELIPGYVFAKRIIQIMNAVR